MELSELAGAKNGHTCNPGACLEVSAVGGMMGPATGHLIWHRPSPRWRQRVEMLLVDQSNAHGRTNVGLY